MEQEKVISYYVKSVYGNDLFYVADAKIRAALERLTGSKTLTWHAMHALKELGYTFKEVLRSSVET